jgi:hypothetical protein
MGVTAMNIEISQEVSEKKNYFTPELTPLGSIATTVQNALGTGPDGMTSLGAAGSAS